MGDVERLTVAEASDEYPTDASAGFVTVDERGCLLTQRLVNPGHDIRYRFAYPPEGRAPGS